MYDYATRVAGHDFTLATRLAVEGTRSDGSHPIPSLDVGTANTGTARGCVERLNRIWDDTIASPPACRQVRDAMGAQPFTHRLASDLQADDFSVAAKTGTFLDLRHDIGVVGYRTQRVAIAALTASRRVARVQADVDLTIGRAARAATEALTR